MGDEHDVCACGCGCEPDGDWHWSQQPWCPCVSQGCSCVTDAPKAQRMDGFPLTIELVPRTCWYTNVRSNVTTSQWEVCKRYVRERSGSRCEVCGERGRRWPVECHEVWDYNDDTHVQTLVDLIALCPTCHNAKHLGRSEVVMGRDDLVALYGHIGWVNRWTIDTVLYYRDLVFKIWELRSQEQWTLDISMLSKLGLPTEVVDR